MSKQTFSKAISESMQNKIYALELNNSSMFLEEDENFQIALCLAYMTLSKEKIIEKDMKERDRMKRLSQKVDQTEIDKVFDESFAKAVPNIIYAKENNNLWILDNIRDSIMHGAFEIDEERKLFLIDNKQYDRDFTAEIPFSWFIAYAKNDILSKKILDKYTVKGFYYNKLKDDRRYFLTKHEVRDNILYRINIVGNKFNVRNIEKRIKELFNIYKDETITKDMIDKYKDIPEKEKKKYGESYLVSFYMAREKVKESIEKEFPGVTLSIQIDNRKSKLDKKTEIVLPLYYNDYDVVMDELNKQVSSKSMTLLKYISNMIENIDSKELISIEETQNQKIDNTNRFNILLTNAPLVHKELPEISMISEQNLKILRSICINIYGLSTLVINHQELYNDTFFTEHPGIYGIKAYQKSHYLEYAEKRKSLILKILETENAIYTKQKQLKECNIQIVKSKIQTIIGVLETKKEVYVNELNNLAQTLKFERIENHKACNLENKQKLEEGLEKYYQHFKAAKEAENKWKIQKVIEELLEAQILEESKYTYGLCQNMKDVLTIIRNSFSHIGRVCIGKERGLDTNIILKDYDNNGEKTGEVLCKYQDLIDLLNAPYLITDTNTKKLTKKDTN